jgi:hypothetical protein
MFGYSPPPEEPNLLSRDVWRFVQVRQCARAAAAQACCNCSASTPSVLLLLLLSATQPQRLDLSTPIRNPRRDLCNGFLAAELLSNFYVS